MRRFTLYRLPGANWTLLGDDMGVSSRAETVEVVPLSEVKERLEAALGMLPCDCSGRGLTDPKQHADECAIGIGGKMLDAALAPVSSAARRSGSHLGTGGGQVSRREQAIADAKAMRQTHVEWLEHLGQCDHMDQPKCVICSREGMDKVVGDADHHRACIEKYDNLIACLLEVVPLSEVREALREAAADRQDVGLSRTVGELLDAALASTDSEGQG